MQFCGQCGRQLAPGDTNCPRCGAPVDAGVIEEDENLQPDAPTIASESLLVRRSRSGILPSDDGLPPDHPQKLVLRSSSDLGDYNTQSHFDAMQQSTTQNYGTYAGQQPLPSTSYPGYTQSGGNYQQPYPGFGQAGYPSQVGQYPAVDPQTNGIQSRGKSAGLVLILLGLLFILSALVLFALQRNGIVASTQDLLPIFF